VQWDLAVKQVRDGAQELAVANRNGDASQTWKSIPDLRTGNALLDGVTRTNTQYYQIDNAFAAAQASETGRAKLDTSGLTNLHEAVQNTLREIHTDAVNTRAQDTISSVIAQMDLEGIGAASQAMETANAAKAQVSVSLGSMY
jgi:hypothetical protein